MRLVQRLFFDPEPPTEEQLSRGRRCLIAEGAVAGVLYSIGTGNFLTGYLGQMGASVSFCALMAMIPQAGCVLQFFSPLLFERMHQRKLAIVQLENGMWGAIDLNGTMVIQPRFNNASDARSAVQRLSSY